MIGTLTKLKEGWYVKYFEDGTVIHIYLPLHPDDVNLMPLRGQLMNDHHIMEGKKVNFEVVVEEETSEYYAKLITSKEPSYELEYNRYMKTFVNSNLIPPTIEQFVDKVNTDSDFAKYWGPGGKEQQKQLITEIMEEDAKDGLYDSVNDTVNDIVNELDKLAYQYNPVMKLDAEFIRAGFKAGYNKAKEKYKYTEEDLKKAFKHGILFKEESVSTCKEAIEAEFSMLVEQAKEMHKAEQETLYTEEQVKQAINRAVILTLSDKSCNSDEIIQSLKQPKQ